MNQLLENRNSSQFDAYSDTYNQTVNNVLAFTGMSVDIFTEIKMSYLLELVRSRVDSLEALQVLDVGCGIGNGHSLLINYVGGLTGVDVSARCIERARKNNPLVEYSLFGGTKLPYEDASFDVAFAVCVFHHVPLGDRCLLTQDIRRVLRKGGMFIIFEHNARNPFTMYIVNRCEFDQDAILLDREAAESLMLRSGFKDVSTRFILTVPARGRISRLVDRWFAQWPIGAQYYTVGRL